MIQKNKTPDINALPLKFIKGVGEKREKYLNEIGIHSVTDILFYFPIRYYDRSSVVPVAKAGEALLKGITDELTFIGKIAGVKRIYTKYRKMLEVKIEDNGYFLKAVFLHSIDIFEKIFSGKSFVAFSGKLSASSSTPVLYHPQFDFFKEIESPDFVNTGAIVPFYPTKSVGDKKEKPLGTYALREIIQRVIAGYLPDIEETLPEYLIKENEFSSIQDTVKILHSPKTFEELKKAQQRIKFEEILYFHLVSKINYLTSKEKSDRIKFTKTGKNTALFIEKFLPFSLTEDQKNVLNEIYKDFSSGFPMNRLLQGEVGSGKTIVALITAIIAFDNGFQTAVMAPTEILANQHYNNFTKLLENLNISVCLITGSTPKKLRDKYLAEIENGKMNIVIGTHALIESDINFNKLGYAIVDEQHRFGVMQRARLKEKGYDTHFLLMTATPIPRTMSMTIYSNLDISTIRTLPKNRKKIKTYLADESKRKRIYDFIRKEVSAGHGAYIVYPIIEESEKLELKDLLSNFENLQKNIFPDLKLAMLHGQMDSAEKDLAMNQFKEGNINILVCTTVVEVGVDNPEATVILIEEPQRFGLSQLHQLRGRVGRGDKQSYCLLLADNKYFSQDNSQQSFFSTSEEKENKNSIRRLQVIVNCSDGFEISEEDLKLRGPGDMFGTKQSGMPEFRYIDLSEDYDLIISTRAVADKIISEDPHLINQKNSVLRRRLTEKFRDKLLFAKIS